MRFLFRALIAAALLVLSDPVAGQCALRIGLLPAADTLVLHVAADEGLFAAQGLDVELLPFQSALEIGAAMRSGVLDGHFGDIINVLVQHTSGAPQAIVATTTRSSAAQRCFGLVLSPKSAVTSLEGLAGKDVAVANSTIVDYLLDALLSQQGMNSDHVNRQDIRQIPVRLQMVMGGQLEAALLPEPLVSLLEAKGARTLLDDRRLRVPLAVVAMSRPALTATPDLAQRMRSALTAAAERINADPEKYRAVMVEKKLLPAAASANYVMIRFDLVNTPAGLPTEQEIMDVVHYWMRGREARKFDFNAAEVLAR